MTNSTKIIGAKELEEALRKLAPMIVGLKGYPKNVLRNAARAGAKIAEEDARQRAPKDTGALKQSITIKLLETRYRDQALLAGNSKEYYYIGAKSGKGRDDPNGAWYAHFVERGTDRMAARPYLRPAVESNQSRIQSTIADKLRADLIKIAKKIGDENTRQILMASK